MKDIFHYFFLICAAFWLESPCFADPTVGYGYTTTFLPLEEQEAFLHGFDLGLESEGTKSRRVLRTDTGSEFFSAARVAQQLMREEPVVIVGFPSSDEALKALPVLLRQESVCIFLGAGDPSLGKLGPRFISTGGTMLGATEDLLALADHLFPKRNGIILLPSSSVLTPAAKADLQKHLQEGYRHMATTIQFIMQDQEFRIVPNDLEKVRQAEYLVFTTSPRDSFQLLEQFASAGIELPVIAVSSWTTTDSMVLRRILRNRTLPLYSMGVAIPGVNLSPEFLRKVEEFSIDKTRIASVTHGFDAGVIVGQTLKRLEDSGARATPQSFLSALYSNPVFEGTSNGSIAIRDVGGQSDRPSDYVEFDMKLGWKALSTPLPSPSRRRASEHQNRTSRLPQ